MLIIYIRWHGAVIVRPQIVQVAAAVETGCRHPLAEAVVFAADKDTPGRSLLDTKGLCTVPGMGANAQVIFSPTLC